MAAVHRGGRVHDERITGTVVAVSREFIEIRPEGKGETVKYPPHTLLDTGAVCHWETESCCYLLDDGAGGQKTRAHVRLAVHDHPAVVADADGAEDSPGRAAMGGASRRASAGGEERGGDGLAGIRLDRLAIDGQHEGRAARHALADPPLRRPHGSLPRRGYW